MHLTEASCDACAFCVAGRADRKWTGADAIPAEVALPFRCPVGNIRVAWFPAK